MTSLILGLAIIFTMFVCIAVWIILSFTSWAPHVSGRTLRTPLFSSVATLLGTSALVVAGATRQTPLIIEVLGLLTLGAFIFFLSSVFSALEKEISSSSRHAL